MKKRRIYLFSLFLLISASGCWDIRDINSTAFAVSMGIDKPINSTAANYRVTLEFAKPVWGKSMPESLIVSAEGRSVHQAIQRIQTSISRGISFSHLRILVIGELIAKERNFKDLSNYLFKEPEVALRLRLVFVQGDTAQALFLAKPKFNQLLASELVAMSQLERQLSLVRTNYFYHFWLDLKTSKGTGIASRVVLKDGGKSLVREGASIYKNWKLIAWLNANEAQNANWLLKKGRPVVVAGHGDKSYSYQVTKRSTKIQPEFHEGKLSFLVKVTTDGMVMEETGEEVDFAKEKFIKYVEAMFAKTIKEQVESAVDKSQHQLKSDYLGFGKALKNNQPKKFESLDWPKVFPMVPISVEVKSKVSSSGLQT